jgi:hypothetical protein
VASYFSAKYAATQFTKNEQKGLFVVVMLLLGGKMLILK